MFVVFWCSVTGLVVSESYKVLMLSQTSLFSWVNRYLYCSIYAVVFCGCFFPDIVWCGCVWCVSDGCLLGRLLFLLFFHTSFCFCVFRSWQTDGWWHARWMGVGVDWITESKAHQSYSVCWGFFVLVAGSSKLSVVCVCARARAFRRGVEGLPRCNPKFQPWGVAFCCLFEQRARMQGTKCAQWQSPRRERMQGLLRFCTETRIDWKLWK